MSLVATELQWGYTPTDFFEARCAVALGCGALELDDGKATLRLTAPTDPVPTFIREQASAAVADVFNARRLLVHRDFTLQGPHMIQLEDNGKRHIAVAIDSLNIKVAMGTVDVLVTNSRGEVVRDSRAERLTEHLRFVTDVAAKAGKSPLLRRLLQSYGAAVGDPNDELVHLYEIRDALAEYFKSDARARSTLGITKVEWNLLGRLANAEPLEQGRHRGQHANSARPATIDELRTARENARLLVEGFAKKIP